MVKRLELPLREPSSPLLKFSFSMTSSPLVMPRYARLRWGRRLRYSLKVADRIFNDAVLGVLRGKTVLMVTNDVNVSEWDLSIDVLNYRFIDINYQLIIQIIDWINLQRLSRCDRVLLMEGGRIVVSGTHSELLTLSDQYSTYCHDASQRCKGFTTFYSLLYTFIDHTIIYLFQIPSRAIRWLLEYRRRSISLDPIE